VSDLQYAVDGLGRVGGNISRIERGIRNFCDEVGGHDYLRKALRDIVVAKTPRSRSRAVKTARAVLLREAEESGIDP